MSYEDELSRLSHSGRSTAAEHPEQTAEDWKQSSVFWKKYV